MGVAKSNGRRDSAPPPPLLAVALNGSRDHQRTPRTPDDLAAAARASAAAGARVIHLHPYDSAGRETKSAEPNEP